MKNSLLSRDLNPGSFEHESSALPLDHEFPQQFHLCCQQETWRYANHAELSGNQSEHSCGQVLNVRCPGMHWWDWMNGIFNIFKNQLDLWILADIVKSRMWQVHGLHLAGLRPVQVEHVPYGPFWGAWIVPEVNGDCHSQPYQHPCQHQWSVGPHQWSQQALGDSGATLHSVEKTWIEDQPAKVLLWSSGGQLLGFHANTPIHCTQDWQPQSICRCLTSQWCSWGETVPRSLQLLQRTCPELCPDHCTAECVYAFSNTISTQQNFIEKISEQTIQRNQQHQPWTIQLNLKRYSKNERYTLLE